MRVVDDDVDVQEPDQRTRGGEHSGVARGAGTLIHLEAHERDVELAGAFAHEDLVD